MMAAGEFSLLESLLWTPDGQTPESFRAPAPWGHAALPPVTQGYVLREAHLERLERSAGYFGFACDRAAVEAALEQTAAGLGAGAAAQKVRLLLQRDGSVVCQAAALQPMGSPVRVALAREAVAAGDPFLRHKTTRREVYDTARAACPQAGDVLLWDSAGRLTESSLANIVCRLDGRLLTPAGDDLLPGALRGWLVERGMIQPADIPSAALQRSTELWLINSVRGWMPAVYGVNSI